MTRKTTFLTAILPLCSALIASGQQSNMVAMGGEAGWKPLLKADFVQVNSSGDTWKFDDAKGGISCTGDPVSVMRTEKAFTNFELTAEWRHMKEAGNSGIFVWTSMASLESLKAPGLPTEGIEVQILDPGFTASWEKSSGKKADWFTCHGDVFAVGTAKLAPFAPLSPDGSRSFPTAETTKPHGEWNHYYVRAINGEIRLWVNGTEVSGGNNAFPANGHICLESEGSPIEFRNLKVRELP